MKPLSSSVKFACLLYIFSTKPTEIKSRKWWDGDKWKFTQEREDKWINPSQTFSDSQFINRNEKKIMSFICDYNAIGEAW